jgi:anti-sigma factor ChrR (cupin superfamily)
MTVHQELDDAATEQASLHAFDLLPPAEREEYETHLSVCHLCRSEVRKLRGVVAELGRMVEAEAPDRRLGERLRASIERTRPRRVPAAQAEPPPTPVQTWKSWAPDAPSTPMVYVAAGEEGFAPTGTPGVEVRRLFVDAANDRATMLVRMRPGSAYPAHCHAGIEECFVLAGDIHVGDRRMRAGDYQRADRSSVHAVQSTEGGCLLFIVSSLHDELLGGEARA